MDAVTLPCPMVKAPERAFRTNGGALRCTKNRILSLRIVVVIPLLLVAALFAQSRTKHPITITDLMNLRSADWLQLSPDGQKLAYTVEGEIWVADIASPSEARILCKGRLPTWSPNGLLLAYYQETEDGMQLAVHDLKTSQSEQITDVKGGIDPDPNTIMLGYVLNPLKFSWSPDSTKIVFASQVVGIAPRQHSLADDTVPVPGKDGEPLILTNDTPAGWTLSNLSPMLFGTHHWAFWEKDRLQSMGRVSQLFIIDARTRALSQLTFDDRGCFNPDWGPDGSKIACVSSEGRSIESALGGTPTNVHLINIGTKERRGITNDELAKWMPSWSPDGLHIAFGGSSRFGLRKLFVISVADGAVIDLTSHLRRAVDDFAWNSDSKSIIVDYNDGVSKPLARIEIRNGQAQQIGDGSPAGRSLLTVARSGAVIWQQNDPSAPALIHLLQKGASASQPILDFNPQIQEWDLGRQEVVHWKNHSSQDLEGVLLKPVGYTPGHRYPVIVDVYPFQGNSFKGYVMLGNHAWAARGYAVFWPSAPAPNVWVNPFKSESYNQAAKGPKGWSVTLDDVLTGVDHLSEQGVIDSDKMCLYGFSNGAGVVNYLVTQTNRFKCAVSIAGAMSDWVRPSLLDTDSWVPPLYDGVTVWDDPLGYLQLSAVFHLNKAKTPMLLADGDEDKGFLLNTIEMYNGLRHFRQDVILLRYPGQEHGFTGASMIDFWKRETAFVDSHLRGSQSALRH
jgi:dipeptidyl aminopeptidase/acylaminoacyl peptidase